MRIQITRLPHAEGLPLPLYATEGSAGMDLRAAIEGKAILPAGDKLMVPTGFCIAVPPGYEAQVRPRSGLAAKSVVTVLNTPGTIDSDYRGEIKVILMNHSARPLLIEPGDRIAQLVIAPVIHADWDEVETLDATTRGEGGFGSTGVKG